MRVAGKKLGLLMKVCVRSIRDCAVLMVCDATVAAEALFAGVALLVVAGALPGGLDSGGDEVTLIDTLGLETGA